MAILNLAAITEPTIFEEYVVRKTAEKSALFRSGVIVRDPRIDKLAMGAGKTFNMPFFNDLGATASNVGSDTAATLATPLAMTAGSDVAVKHLRNQSWSALDLVDSVAGKDPMAAVGDLLADYWARDYQRSFIASLQGVLADNVANDSSDMLYDIALDTVAAVADAERISAAAVLEAKNTMGDSGIELVAIAMHSTVFLKLQKQQVIDYIVPSDSPVRVPTYLGMMVIVDDMMPATAGTYRTTYLTALLGMGAIGYGEGRARVPLEVDRIPAAGAGSGQETLHSRREYIMHPRGIAFQNASITLTSPNNTELAEAAEWDRVYERKQVRIAFLETNG